MHGRLNLTVRAVNDLRQQFDYYQTSPLRAFFPKPLAMDSLDVVLANTSGGIVGGDRLEIIVEMKNGSKAAITSQAAEKVYRSTGPETRVSVDLMVGSNARLRWIPQETIFFDGVRFRRRTTIDVSEHGVCLAGEMLVFGRTARGERLTNGLIHDEWLVRHKGRLVWADNFHLSGDLVGQFDSSAGLNGSKAMATLTYAAGNAPQLIGRAKSLIHTERCWSGATLIDSVIIARWLGRDVEALRNDYARFAETFSAVINESTDSLPQKSNA